jgi:hypothetical protein
MSIKKTIIIPIFDDEIIVNVDFSIIEKVERVYDKTAENVAAFDLVNIARIRRSQIAQVICLWVQGKTTIKTSLVNEAIQTCSQTDLYRFVGMIQAAILYSIRGQDGKPLITSEQFDALVSGQDIEVEPTAQSQDAKPSEKKPRKATSGKPTA